MVTWIMRPIANYDTRDRGKALSATRSYLSKTPASCLLPNAQYHARVRRCKNQITSYRTNIATLTLNSDVSMPARLRPPNCPIRKTAPIIPPLIRRITIPILVNPPIHRKWCYSLSPLLLRNRGHRWALPPTDCMSGTVLPRRNKIDKEAQHIKEEDKSNDPFQYGSHVVGSAQVFNTETRGQSDFDEDEGEFDPERVAKDAEFSVVDAQALVFGAAEDRVDDVTGAVWELLLAWKPDAMSRQREWEEKEVREM